MSAAIKAAMQKAQEVAAETAQTQVAEVHQLPAVSAPAVPAKRLTMDSLPLGSMNVDLWIKVKEDGLKLGDNPGLFDEFIVSLDMTDGRGFTPKLGIKAGNPAQYFYTLDGENAGGGGSWDGAVKRALAIDPKAREYRCVDLPLRLEEDVEVKGKPAIKSGTMLGHTTSTTNWGNWEKFYQQVAEAGFLGHRVSVKIGAQARSKNGNTWGVMTFELLGLHEDEGDE